MIGSFYQKRGRWYWQGRLPGDTKRTCIALIPKGHTKATTDRKVAEAVVKRMLENPTPAGGMVRTVYDLCARYQEYAKVYYNSKEPVTVDLSLRVLKEMFGGLATSDFSPLKLKAVRQTMIGAGLCRREINRRIGIIKRMYRWAVEEELVYTTVYDALRAVAGLKQGRTEAIDHPDITAAPAASVEAVLPFTTPVVADMVRLNLLTGMRPDELCRMKPGLLDRSGSPWCYQPDRHKNQYRGQKRKVFLGPQAQGILAKYLMRQPDDFCFKPSDSERCRMDLLRQNRQTPLYGQKGQLPPKPRADLNESYTPDSYRKAINHAQDAAKKAGVAFQRWFPYQLRHTHADLIRKKEGLETEAAVLGHKDVETSKIYAKLDEDRARQAAIKYG